MNTFHLRRRDIFRLIRLNISSASALYTDKAKNKITFGKGIRLTFNGRVKGIFILNPLILDGVKGFCPKKSVYYWIVM